MQLKHAKNSRKHTLLVVHTKRKNSNNNFKARTWWKIRWHNIVNQKRLERDQRKASTCADEKIATSITLNIIYLFLFKNQSHKNESKM